ncbi:MAG: adenylate/guanylate cyclase domain-containing protein [Rhodocyclaceae bacterium]|nr:adenylate/guanylate cyclase domain-containing protein [Rhodocyclaceae bacterium]
MSGNERALAILFADVSGSTRLYEKLGDTEALRAVERCIKRMERVIEGFRGRVVKTIGDEVMAVFDSAEDAFNAASDMQQRITDLPPISGVKLAIRVGFHFGPAIEDKGDYFGDTVNTAARLAGLAKAGQALTSGDTVQQLPELLRQSTRDLDTMSVKGKAEELHVFEVLWQDGEELTMKAPSIRASGPASAKLASSARLCVRYAGEVMVLDEKRPSISLGRDAACDLVIRDRRASRNHGKIERRGDKFVLTDISTNGTYVQLKDEAEFFLRREDLVLRGNGRIAFAASINSEDADIAEFEIL